MDSPATCMQREQCWPARVDLQRSSREIKEKAAKKESKTELVIVYSANYILLVSLSDLKNIH